MIGLGCGIETFAVAQRPPLLPLAQDLTSIYGTLAGMMPAYEPPEVSYLSSAAGDMTDPSGWETMAGAPVIANGWMSFPTSATTQSMRHPLAQSIPAGSRLQLTWRQRGEGGARLRLGPDIASVYVQSDGWWSAELTLGADRSHLTVECQGGSSSIEVTGISLSLVAAEPGHDIVLLMGGANMTGQWCGERADPDIDVPHALVDVVADGQIVSATAPLQHRQRNAGLGPGLAFAHRYAETALAPGRRLLLLPVARAGGRLLDPGAASVSDGARAGWHPSNTLTGAADLFSQALADAQAAVALNPAQNRVVCAYWSGGEAEVLDTFAVDAYQAALRNHLIPALRAGLGAPDLPIVISGANPASVPPSWRMAEAALDQDSLGLAATPFVVHEPWDDGWGDGTRPNPGTPAEALYFSGSANRLRGVAAARCITERLIGLRRLSVIGEIDIITTTVSIAA
ncbi:sialate O-acetylesterase [Roseisalinus antarcticus]|uniref:Sialate O-acetylesterase domain-containing protein n=1 Tax=Roseisalinus antarcticus TaxID=254357 RepID=A0A1Y5RY47_9RHOB|nr:sialate O-acetylesterase [Roseisalinus antarcticus]SLN27089.1 hypothetical protein ROA7023_00852 [Roseisalinus antarcticus]